MPDNSWDRDWLVFSRKSRRGIFVLLFVFVVVAVLPRVYRNHFINSPLKVHVASLGVMNESKPMTKLETISKNNSTSSNGSKTFSYNMPKESFDPNVYTFKDWKAIGFSDKQVETILNYKKSGGVFQIKADVKKLYVVDEELYSELYKFIDLPDSIPVIEKSEFIEESKSSKKVSVNINTASETELKSVHGIGPFFAKQIIKLRENYGGIHHFNQLLEIYNMDEEKLSKIKGNLIIESSDLVKINVNKATRKQLSKHKLITWSIANSIVSMRETHGKYKNLDDLLKSKLINQENLDALKPYLKL